MAHETGMCCVCGLGWFSRIGFGGYVKNSFSSHLFVFVHFLLYDIWSGSLPCLFFTSCPFSSLPLFFSCFCTFWDPGKKNREFIEYNATDWSGHSKYPE